MDKKEKELSKFLSLILRHKPETIGISLDEHGWADVGGLIAGIGKTHKIDMEMLVFLSENGVWLSKHVPKEFIEVYDSANDKGLN
jgi:RNA:NAD 2'-phosphotransferase (TPT1/KptA family)